MQRPMQKKTGIISDISKKTSSCITKTIPGNTPYRNQSKRSVVMHHIKYYPKQVLLVSLIKKAIAAVLLFCSVLLLLPDSFFSGSSAGTSLSIEDRILRLHILAAGDDTASQEIKLHVRDAVLSVIQDTVAPADTAEEAEALLLPHLDTITAAANEVLAQYGVSYHATATVTTEFFPIKQYGSLLLPPGDYRALRIVLGEGEGTNWWCMLYPSLCFTEGITGTLPEEEQEELKGLLTEEEYDLLFSKKAKKPVKFKFRIVKLWRMIKDWF